MGILCGTSRLAFYNKHLKLTGKKGHTRGMREQL
jgi:hypothetical protein